MNLKEYFANQSRTLAVALRINSPSIKKIVSSRKKSEETGVMSIFDFNGFKVNISYMEQAGSSYMQQTIWVAVSLDCDDGTPYSLYDILAFTEPRNFNCYTYTYVDSQQLMKNCFEELEEVLKKNVPILEEMLQNGITKNKIVTTQRNNINTYFGDNVLESGEMIGSAADKIISMMLQNFYESQLEAAVIGVQSYFYNGNHEKALKKLKKAKRRSFYQDNLLKFLEEGGTSENISKTVQEASADKGIRRQSGGIKGALKMLLYAMGFSVLLAVAGALFYTLFFIITFRGNVFTAGYFDNIVLLPFVVFPLGFALSLNYIIKKEEKADKKDSTAVHIPKYPKYAKNVVKYFTIIGESIALIGCISSVFSCTSFYKDCFTFAETDFPASHNVCEYTSVESVNLIQGFTYGENKFREENYIVIKTKSGQTINLYNSTWLSNKQFLENKEFFEEKNIPLNTYKTIEDYENNKQVSD